MGKMRDGGDFRPKMQGHLKNIQENGVCLRGAFGDFS